jgi:predicted SAM-dependent methyltransferase
MIKLDIGAGGPSGDDSFISIDKYVESADIKADMWELPFADGEVDIIYASHCLEHISKYMVMPTLLEWKRVLKVGGRLQVLVPDLTWACMWWLQHPYNNWCMDIIYGNQKHEGQFHKTGFTPDIMRYYIQDIPGLEIRKITYFGGTIEDIYKTYKEGDVLEQRVINFEIERVEDGQSDIV